MDDGVSGEQRLRVVGRLAVIAQVQQTLGAVEISWFDPLAADARVAAVCRLGRQLRALAQPQRVAAAAATTSVSDRRRRKGSDRRAVGGQPGDVAARGARDEAPRSTGDGVVGVGGRRDAVQTAVVGQTALAERVPTVEVSR